MLIRHQLLQSVVDPIFIPNEEGQELLQGSHRYPRRQSDRFDALAFQISHQPSEVMMPVFEGLLPWEERTKPFQQRSQRRLQRSNLIGIHDQGSQMFVQEPHRRAILGFLSLFSAVILVSVTRAITVS